MSDPKALEDHLGGIKERLVQFSLRKPHGPEHVKAVRQALQKDGGRNYDSLFITAQDEFIHCRRLRCSNRRILDHFIESDKLLTEEDRQNLDGYRDYHVGMLEVVEHRAHSMVVNNLLNGWHGEVRANNGIENFFDDMTVGSFMLSAIVYYGEDAWLSGAQTTLPDVSRDHALQLAIGMARETPSVMVRGNRERERAGFAAQAERHRMFVQFFGRDYVLCTPKTWDSTQKSFERYCLEHTKGPDGLTFKERCYANGEPEQWENVKLPEIDLPESFYRSEQIALCSSSEKGLSMDINSPPIFAALEAGDLKALRRLGKRLRPMITDPEAEPVIIRSMARNFPELFGAAVKDIFSFRRFHVETGLEPLLFRYKGMNAEVPRYPQITMIDPGDPLSQALYG